MSTLDANGKYPEYQKSTMPSTIDNIPKMRNASIADEALISQYVALKQAGKIEEAAAFLAQNEGLEETMWDADKWNTMADAIMATEKTFIDNMAGYTAQVASDMATQISEEYATNNATTISNAIDTQVFDNEDVIPISKGGTGANNLDSVKSQWGIKDAAGYTLKEILSVIYPVGSIYMSVKNSNPSSLFGGTWISWGNGKVPVGVDSNDTDFNAVEKSGGSKKLQSHNHTFTGSQVTTSTNNVTHVHEIPQLTGMAASAGAHTHPTQQGDHYVMSSKSIINDEAGGKIADTGYVYPAAPAGTDFTTDNGTGSAGKHTHSITTRVSTTGKNSDNHTHTVTAAGTIKSTGEGTAQNLQPYITCYMWKRTA